MPGTARDGDRDGDSTGGRARGAAPSCCTSCRDPRGTQGMLLRGLRGALRPGGTLSPSPTSICPRPSREEGPCCWSTAGAGRSRWSSGSPRGFPCDHPVMFNACGEGAGVVWKLCVSTASTSCGCEFLCLSAGVTQGFLWVMANPLLEGFPGCSMSSAVRSSEQKVPASPLCCW